MYRGGARQKISNICAIWPPNDEVKEQDYNLSVNSYVEAEDTREKIDIVKLNAEIQSIVVREQVLRDEIDKIIAEIGGRGA